MRLGEDPPKSIQKHCLIKYYDIITDKKERSPELWLAVLGRLSHFPPGLLQAHTGGFPTSQARVEKTREQPGSFIINGPQ